jgi:hypothetical protein
MEITEWVNIFFEEEESTFQESVILWAASSVRPMKIAIAPNQSFSCRTVCQLNIKTNNHKKSIKQIN